jgi:hypothetical protein
MDKGKFTDKLKEGVSVDEIESFAKKHMTEVLTVLALIVGAVSSAFDFFTGPGLTLIFAAVGTIFGIFFPAPVERGLKQFYQFTYKQEKTTQMVLGAVKVVMGIFIPFVLFGLLGLLAGTSYHYFTRQAQIFSENRPPKGPKGPSGEEHD